MNKLFLFCLLGFSVSSAARNPTASEIIEQIKTHINCEWDDETVDTFKSGNADDEVTGAVCCMFADVNVLKDAVAKKCNLIITHEPVYYNHLDETSGLDHDPIFQEKLNYINENHLIIWRFHDHWHRHQPDGIYIGLLDKLGWSSSTVKNNYRLVIIEKQSLKKLSDRLQSIFQIPGIRVIGDPNLEVSKIGLMLGAPGAKKQIQMLQTDIDLMIGGEAQEWETYQYVNDAVIQGKNKAVIFLGHIKSEEAGMAYFAKWLATFQKKVPIVYSENKVPYWEPSQKL